MAGDGSRAFHPPVPAGPAAATRTAGVGEAVRAAEQRGLRGQPAEALVQLALARTDDATARGRILLCRARVSAGPERREAYTAALTEFSTAGDASGQALALAGVVCPRPDDDDGVVASYRLRIARDALAHLSGDPHVTAVALCRTRLARKSGPWKPTARPCVSACAGYLRCFEAFGGRELTQPRQGGRL